MEDARRRIIHDQSDAVKRALNAADQARRESKRRSSVIGLLLVLLAFGVWSTCLPRAAPLRTTASLGAAAPRSIADISIAGVASASRARLNSTGEVPRRVGVSRALAVNDSSA